MFADRDHIWNSTDVKNGMAYMWHYRNSYRFTKLFGKLACRVTSKILGIGSAERSWGDVKHLKTNKRAHLSGDRVKKQATIFGSSCMEKADLKQSYKESNTKPYQYWSDDDLQNLLSIVTKGNSVIDTVPIARIFKNWEEDWEEESIFKKSPVSEARLLEKYGGLTWFDPDNNQVVYSDGNELKWIRITKKKDGVKSGGYAIVAYDEKYDNGTDENKDDHTEPWEFSIDLRSLIATYYTEHPEFGVKIIETDEVEVEKSNE